MGKGAQEAHEAIRPTYIDRTSINGTAQEKKLYDLIWKRTLASQMAPAVFLKTDISIGAPGLNDRFGATSEQVRFDGFLKVYRESTDDEQQEEWSAALPEIHIGDKLTLDSAKAAGKYTQPPFRYSEASLVKKLEELGIGRPSTYAPTISTLTKARGYIAIGDKEGEKREVKNILLKNGNISHSVSTEVVGAEKRKLLPQEIGMLVTDYLVEHFSEILDYGFTAGVEEDFDKIAHGQEQWKAVIGRFYAPFHQTIDSTMAEKTFSKREDRLLGQDEQGRPVVVKYGQFGAYVQIGEGEDKASASLSQGQLMESITLEEALKLFLLPRTVGSYKGIDIISTKGRFGPYLKYGDKNVSLPRGAKAESISLEKCIEVIEAADNKPALGPIAVFEGSDIQVLNGRYGPYIKQGGNNYRIPRGTDAATLTEADCRALIAGSQPTAGKTRRFPKKK